MTDRTALLTADFIATGEKQVIYLDYILLLCAPLEVTGEIFLASF